MFTVLQFGPVKILSIPWTAFFLLCHAFARHWQFNVNSLSHCGIELFIGNNNTMAFYVILCYMISEWTSHC